MKNLLALFVTALIGISVLAQPVIVEPGSKHLNGSSLFLGQFTWESNNSDQRLVNVKHHGQEITIELREAKKGIIQSTQTLLLNANTLEPISENYKDDEDEYNLQFGGIVKGKSTDFETDKTESINEKVNGKQFHAASIPYIISTLPISLDYRVTLPVLRFDNNWKPNYLKYKITDVSEVNNSFSCISGVHDFWKVLVEEKTTNMRMFVFFDKSTRRIRRLEYSFDGFRLSDNTYILVDTELDINPIKATFNMAETRSMITGGTSNIKGQASTKISEKRMVGNKTQYAPKGSIVTLIPYTPYFQEWVAFNLSIGNVSRPIYYDGKLVSGCSYPMPEEVKSAMLYTEVIDNKGNFEFRNLKQGEYLVFVGFVANKYTHTTRTPTGNYNITLSPDGYGSATQVIDVKNWMSPRDVLNHQIVKIVKDGEIVNVVLK